MGGTRPGLNKFQMNVKTQNGLTPFRIILILLFQCKNGRVAQLVEQRTENPCVGGSSPSSTTPQSLPSFSEARLFL